MTDNGKEELLSSQGATETPVFGMLLAVLGYSTLPFMNALIKYLTLQGYPTLQVMFFNGAVAFSCVFGWLFLKKGLAKVKIANPFLGLYVLVSLGGCFALFYAFGTGKLAEVGAIVAVSPLFIALLSHFFLRERLSLLQIGLILFGFLGVMLVLKPRPELTEYGVVCIALLGTFLFASSQVLVRKLRGVVPTLAFTFYFYLGLLVIAGLTMPYRVVALADAPFFLLSGLCDVISLVLLYSAFRHAPAPVVAPFQYGALLWNALLGYFIWHENLSIWTVMGAAVIIGAGILFMRSSLKLPDSRDPEQ
ncbi:MAG: DMT family transporter [Pseudomonadota bacterium]